MLLWGDLGSWLVGTGAILVHQALSLVFPAASYCSALMHHTP